MGLYLRPDSIDAALASLAERKLTLLAGGTDHFPARATQTPDEDILDLTRLPGLRGMARQADGWFLPCLTTWTDIAEAALPPQFDALRQAARQVGGAQVQNAGTVVGNICNASPAADGMPPLLALGAEVVLASRAGQRVLPLGAFVLGPRRTARRDDELVLGLRIPAAAASARSCFLKLGARAYLVISIAMVAAFAEFAADGRIARARVAVGACSPVAARLPGLEAALVGQFPATAHVEPEHLQPLSPIDDIRATAAYRRAAALELVRRAVMRLAVPRAAAA